MRQAALSTFVAIALMACEPAVSEPLPQKEPAPVTTVRKSALPKNVLVLKRASITDPGVIARMNAMTVLIPDGWTSQGGIERQPNLCAEIFGVNWVATSPDGNSAVFIFPTEGWAASTTPVGSPCMNAEFQTTADYLAARIQLAYPGAVITGFTPREDFFRDVAAATQAKVAMGRQMGLDMQGWADGGEMRFSFKQNGAAMDGLLSASSQFYVTSAYNPMGGSPMQSLTAATLGTFGATAPAGKLDLQLAEAVRRSVTPNADWLQQYFAASAQFNQTATQGIEQRAAMIVAGGAAATRRNIEAFRNMTAATAANGMPDPVKTGGDTVRYSNEDASDRQQRESIEAIRGVETYYDQVGGQNVQLDATYDNAWRVNNKDTYILTNDPNFNPGLYDIEATQMKVVK
jgi:hypothetical protein